MPKSNNRALKFNRVIRMYDRLFGTFAAFAKIAPRPNAAKLLFLVISSFLSINLLLCSIPLQLGRVENTFCCW